MGDKDKKLLDIAENHVVAKLIQEDSRSSPANRILAKRCAEKVIPARLHAEGLSVESSEYRKVLLDAEEIRKKRLQEKKKDRNFFTDFILNKVRSMQGVFS